jgi:hypothetical protein
VPQGSLARSVVSLFCALPRKNPGLASRREPGSIVVVKQKPCKLDYFFTDFGAELNSDAVIFLTVPADIKTYPPSVGTFFS